jgi:hypothetical protein
MHLNALPAAQAFECAYSQQHQESLSRIIFEHQSALGDVAWDSLG